jgi:hypothetical protein
MQSSRMAIYSTATCFRWTSDNKSIILSQFVQPQQIVSRHKQRLTTKRTAEKLDFSWAVVLSDDTQSCHLLTGTGGLVSVDSHSVFPFIAPANSSTSYSIVSITGTGGLVSVRRAIVVATQSCPLRLKQEDWFPLTFILCFRSSCNSSSSIVSITGTGGLVSVDNHSVFPFVL